MQPGRRGMQVGLPGKAGSGLAIGATDIGKDNEGNQ